MGLQRWYPRADVRRVDNTADRLRRAFGGWELLFDGYAGEPLLDVVEEDEQVSIRASLPGINPEDVSVTVENGVLSIEGSSGNEEDSNEGRYLVRERRNGAFRRAVRLPDSVDADKAAANYAHGVLTITLPKQESKKARKVEIEVGS